MSRTRHHEPQPSGKSMEERTSVQYSTLPTKPSPSLQYRYGVPSSSLAAGSLNARNDLLQSYMHNVQHHGSHGTSVSSAGGDSTVTADTIDLEKGILGVEMHDGKEARHARISQGTEMSERQHKHSSSRASAHEHHMSISHEHAEEAQEILIEDKALKLLSFLCGPLAALSLLLALWTVLSIIFSGLLQPFRLCARRPNLHEQITSLLAAPLNFQLQCIYSSVEPISFSIPMLLAVHLLSPMLALGVMIWSWVIAIYWMFAVMVGNPDGLDGRNDGKELVLQLRLWWEDWLCKAVTGEA